MSTPAKVDKTFAFLFRVFPCCSDFFLFWDIVSFFLFMLLKTFTLFILLLVLSQIRRDRASQTEMHNTRWSITHADTHSHASMTDLTHSGVLTLLQKIKVFFCILSLCKDTWYNIRGLLDGPHTHRHKRTMIMFQQSGSKLPLKPKRPLVYFN